MRGHPGFFPSNTLAIMFVGHHTDRSVARLVHCSPTCSPPGGADQRGQRAPRSARRWETACSGPPRRDLQSASRGRDKQAVFTRSPTSTRRSRRFRQHCGRHKAPLRHEDWIARCAYRSSRASEKRSVVAGWTRVVKPDPGHRLHQVQHLDRGAVVRWALPPRHLCGHAEPVPAGDFYRRPHARGAPHPAHLSTARGARAAC